MKWMGIFLSLTFTLAAHAQWVDVWQASPDVWEEPTNPARFQVSDFEILKKSPLSRQQKKRLLASCVNQFSDSKSYFVGDRFGNNYQVSELSSAGEVQTSCEGRVAETLCRQQRAQNDIARCLTERF